MVFGEVTDHAGRDEIRRLVATAARTRNDMINRAPEGPESGVASRGHAIIIPAHRARKALVHPPPHSGGNHSAAAVTASPPVMPEHRLAERGFGRELRCPLLLRDIRQQACHLAQAMNAEDRRRVARLLPHIEESSNIGLLYECDRFLIAVRQDHIRIAQKSESVPGSASPLLPAMAVRTLRKCVARLLGGVTHDHCNSLSRGGLKVGDIILAFNEVEIDEAARLRREIDRAGTGARVTAIVRRDIRTRIWELLVGCVYLFTIDNVQRFTFAGAAYGTFRGGSAAGIRAGERKTC